MLCDVAGCPADAVTVLRFRGVPGHVHVCPGHERVDREWCDVVGSGPMPCPAGCETTPQLIGFATPPLL